ncbi:MAG: hypothetical protein JW786_03315 [Desulfobacterales bacterium]|nr:hypothetical protein [Desulfobacterales bacterium]
MNDLNRGNVNIAYFLIAFLFFFIIGIGLNTRQLGASVPQMPCSACHVMHKAEDDYRLTLSDRKALLNNTCIGCHTGTNNGGDTPYVFSSIEPIYNLTGTEANTNTLAGGNFYWVKQSGGDSMGHNVADLQNPDENLLTPPGFDGGRPAADGTIPGNGTWPVGQSVSCAGTYGCHGKHDSTFETTAIKGSHHQGGNGAIIAPGTEPAGGYRMLVGIAGYEDPDWEFRPTSSKHNQYKGADGTGGSDDSTISYLCAECHWDYHIDIAPWIHHPSDYDMGNTAIDSEYREYGGVSNAYEIVTPVGSNVVSAVKSNVTFNDDTIVTCISCHRAHGTPYAKSFRWDYMGGIGDGCTNCHTSK